ncbi:MAG: hypothetical protein LBN02_05285 [Oscillospiraceae bacterium]|jgi:hypothetical protein|nr:hypothetical protein [Oscillospiraceae bacterium]
MKKLFSLILAVLLVISAAACNAPTMVEPSPTPQIGAVLPDVPRDFPDEPYSPLVIDEIGAQYYGAPQYEFIPSDDYGAIVPYIGDILRPNLGFNTDSALVGFATLDGRVICEPMFFGCYSTSLGGETVYIAQRDRYTGGKNVKEYWLIPASGAYSARYDEISTRSGAYLTYRQGDKWGVVALGGTVILPPISDCEIDAFTGANGDAFLITELSDTWTDYTYYYNSDIEYAVTTPGGKYSVTVHAPEIVAHYFVDSTGARLTETECVDYGVFHIEYNVGSNYGVKQNFDYGYTIPDGFGKVSRAVVYELDRAIFKDYTDMPNEYLDIDPRFVLYCTLIYAETRLPDGTVIVRRSLTDTPLD